MPSLPDQRLAITVGTLCIIQTHTFAVFGAKTLEALVARDTFGTKRERSLAVSSAHLDLQQVLHIEKVPSEVQHGLDKRL